jgi:hypothetical protein
MSPLLQTFANGSALGYRSLSAAAAGDYESIATVTVGSGGASSIDFTSIAGTYTHLQVRLLYGNTNTAQTREVIMRFNSDSGNNYADHQLAGNGSSASASATTSTNAIYVSQCDHSSSGGTSAFGVTIIDILDYANTNKYKTSRQLWGWDGNGSGVMRFSSGLWQNTNAITSIKLLPVSAGDFRQYSHAALYGIKSA